MPESPSRWTAVERVTRVVAVLLALWLIVAWAGTYLQARIGRNCGFYLPLAIHVAEGAAPYSDFWYPYSPGALYVYAALGADALHNPYISRVVAYASQLITLALVYATLRRLAHPPLVSFLLTMVMGVWIFSLASWVVSTETLTMLFLVAAVFLLIRFPGWVGTVSGGLAVGCALMMKQFALLEVPVLALMAVFPPVPAPPPKTAADAVPVERNWWRLPVFAVLVGVPFLVWVVASGAPLIDSFRYCATWGGHAGKHGWGNGLQPILTNLTDDSSTTMVLFGGLCAIWLVAMSRSRINWQLLGLYVCGLVPLGIREFDGYVQYSAYWVILIVAQFSGALAARISAPALGQPALALLLVFPLIQLVGWSTLFLAKEFTVSTLGKQRAVAQSVVEALPERNDVLVINHEWLYYLGDLVPPDLNYKPVQNFDLEYSRPQRDRARYVVYAPDAGRRLSSDAVSQFLSEGGLAPWKIVEPKVGNIGVDRVEIWQRVAPPPAEDALPPEGH